MPSFHLLKRNVRAFLRLCWEMTSNRTTRGPFWGAFWKTLFRNPRGIEGLATLSILYVHFQSILPYCYEQLEAQRTEIETEGDEAWVARNLAEEVEDSLCAKAPDAIHQSGSAQVAASA